MKANAVTHLLVIWSVNLSLSFAADGFTQDTGDVFGTVYRKGSGRPHQFGAGSVT